MNRTLERKAFELAEIKLVDAGPSGGFEGYASVKHNIDSYNDVIRDGAYVGLDRLVKDGFAAMGHDWFGAPIGLIVEAVEDEKGLKVKVQFHSTGAGQEARAILRERLEAGKSVGMSIGYFVLESADATVDGVNVRELKSIEVFEVSIVNMPANTLAGVTQVKASGRTFTEQRENLLAEVRDFVVRVRGLVEIRDRGLSEQKIQELGDLSIALKKALDELDAICAGAKQCEPEATPDQLAELEKIFASIAS